MKKTLLLMILFSGVAHAQNDYNNYFGMKDTILGVGNDDKRAISAGKLTSSRIINYVGKENIEKSMFFVEDFKLNGYKDPSPLGHIISQTIKNRLSYKGDRTVGEKSIYYVNGFIERVNENASLFVTLIRKADGLKIDLNPILLYNMGNRSEQGVITSLKPW